MNRDQLKNIEDYDQFVSLSEELSNHNKSDLFDFLFELSLTPTIEGVNEIASWLLVQIEPEPTRSCAQLIRDIGLSKWDLSNKAIPFYLISQFGKLDLNRELKRYLAVRGISETQKILIEGVGYWVSRGSAYLSGHLNYWEWQEVIERSASDV